MKENHFVQLPINKRLSEFNPQIYEKALLVLTIDLP